jgi:branched-chain amino acid transport system substrate-binding protein
MRPIVSLLLIGLLLVMSGCVQQEGPQPSTPIPQAPTGDQAVEVVRIGIPYPLTGPVAATGIASKEAFELAAEIINNEYPDLNMPLATTIGLPGLNNARIELIFADHQMSPEIGASETERLITQDGVVAIIGAYASAVTNTASQAAERLGIPFVNAQSTSPALHQRGFRWYFRTTPHDAVFSELMFRFLDDLRNDGMEVGKVATIYENTLFGSDSNETQNTFAQQYGFEVVTSLAYPHQTSDMTSEVQRLRSAQVDVVLPTSYIADAILMVRTFKDQNYAPKAILAQGVGFTEGAFLETVGSDGNYILSREVFSADLREVKPLIGQVNDLFNEKYNKQLEGATARSFTALFVLAEAINRAGSTDPEAIRLALLATDIPADQIIMPWEGVRFDPDTGQNLLGTGIIVQAFDGQYFTVWPFDLATRDLVFPMPAWNER